MNFFQDEKGDYSSKRLFGFICLVIGSTLAFLGRDVGVVGIFMGSASAVFITQSITHT